MNIKTISRAERRRATVHAKPVPANRGIVEHDHIPVEIAEAMLFGPGVKLTSRMRKNCMAARETHFQSTLEPKEYTSHLKRAAQSASAAQLLKWARRAVVARAKVTRDYLTLKTKRLQLDPMKLHDIAKAERVLAIMDVKAQQIDSQMASYRSEAERRLLKSDIFNPVRD
jgi:hypothetical protein